MVISRLLKATEIDGCAATEDRDSQNEVLSLEGADISQMVEKGYFNDNHGTGMANMLGKITQVKKIFKKEDADDERQKAYWEKMQRPYLYVKGRLFDESGHENAKAVAAIMKEFQKMGTPLNVQMSVEGKVLNRGNNGLLKESMIRNVALTLVPANNNTGAQILSEDVKKAILAKCRETGANVEYADALMKSLSTGVIATLPGFIEVVDGEPFAKVFENVREIRDRVKTLKAMTAGYGSGGPPASRVGGAALMGNNTVGKKLVSVAGPEALKRKKQTVLKTLIRKTKVSHPDLSYGKIVESVLKVFHLNSKKE